MAIDVVMPQMGESIAEGTVVRWMKKPGDKVERDEPLLEISTDKVDAEIPSPAAGTLSEILVKEGQTVAVNSVVARIAGSSEASATAPPSEQRAASGERAATPPPAPKPATAPAPPGEQRAASSERAATPPPPPEQKAAPAAAPAQPSEQRAASSERVGAPPPRATDREPRTADVTSLDERRRTKSSPLVRKIAQENNVDITQIQGSGISGRVTKNDILGFLQQPATEPARASAPPQKQPQFAPGESVRIEPLSVMRKKIAQHMILSKQTSAHVTTAFEVDFTNVEKLRCDMYDNALLPVALVNKLVSLAAHPSSKILQKFAIESMRL